MSWLIGTVIVAVGVGTVIVYFATNGPIILPDIPPSGRVSAEWFPWGLPCDGCGRDIPNGDYYWARPEDPSNESYHCHDCACVPV